MTFPVKLLGDIFVPRNCANKIMSDRVKGKQNFVAAKCCQSHKVADTIKKMKLDRNSELVYMTKGFQMLNQRSIYC